MALENTDVDLSDSESYLSDIDLDHEIEEELRVHVLGYETDNSDEEYREARSRIKRWNDEVVHIASEIQEEVEKRSVRNKFDASSSGGVSEEGAPNTFVSDYEDSADELHSIGESEEDGLLERKRRRRKIPYVDEFTNFSKFEWVPGIKFPNRERFREAVAKYAIASGRNLLINVSDRKRQHRLGVKCVKGCPFRMYGSWHSGKDCFIVQSVQPEHLCDRDMKKNRQLKASWVAGQFLEVFKNRPHWPAKEIIETIRRSFRMLVDQWFAYRVKYKAHKLLHGSMKEHYSKIGRYLEALKLKNPESVFYLLTQAPKSTPNVPLKPPVFQRFFVCYSGLSKGWLQNCRKVICIDACFIKTFLGGVLLAAVGRDANDQMFPIAWAVAEGENNDSWVWFLMLLKNSMGDDEGEYWTFISDQHLVSPFSQTTLSSLILIFS